jgi:hypothetical protein
MPERARELHRLMSVREIRARSLAITMPIRAELHGDIPRYAAIFLGEF